MSRLHQACHEGDFQRVKQLLQTATLDEINLLDPNGSTPLHTACHQDHQCIVELLLQRGATRRVKNQNQLTPIDETSDERIKQLFQRPEQGCQQRYVTREPQLQWTFTESSVAYTNRLGHLRPYSLEFVVDEFQVAKELQHCEHRNVIDWFSKKAQETNDPLYLLKLYTAETGFFKILNKTMAKNVAFLRNAELIMPWAVYFAGMLCNNLMLEPYRFHGRTYRGMRIHDQDLRQYKIGGLIVNKAFLSTSKNRHIAEIFSGWNDDDPADRETFPVLCIHKITDRQSSIDVEAASEFPDEEEVLIMPSTAFRVINIQTHSHPTKYEIELEEETDPISSQPVVPLPQCPSRR